MRLVRSNRGQGSSATVSSSPLSLCSWDSWCVGAVRGAHSKCQASTAAALLLPTVLQGPFHMHASGDMCWARKYKLHSYCSCSHYAWTTMGCVILLLLTGSDARFESSHYRKTMSPRHPVVVVSCKAHRARLCDWPVEGLGVYVPRLSHRNQEKQCVWLCDAVQAI